MNNVLCFPIFFRASQTTEDMKMAASMANYKLSHEPVPEYVSKAMDGRTFEWDYFVATIFYLRLIERIACAIAQVAAYSGVTNN